MSSTAGHRADAALDRVTEVWLLHLLSPADAEAAWAELARMVRPRGTEVVSADNRVSRGGDVLERDHESVATERPARHGLDPVGTTTFEARSPWGAAGGRDVPVFRLAAFRRT